MLRRKRSAAAKPGAAMHMQRCSTNAVTPFKPGPALRPPCCSATRAPQCECNAAAPALHRRAAAALQPSLGLRRKCNAAEKMQRRSTTTTRQCKRSAAAKPGAATQMQRRSTASEGKQPTKQRGEVASTVVTANGGRKLGGWGEARAAPAPAASPAHPGRRPVR